MITTGDDRVMRTVNTTLVQEYAERLRPLLPVARRAYGAQPPDSPARRASTEVNRLIKEYADVKGGNITHLANELEGSISLAGLRRRLRAARGKPLQSIPGGRKRGSTDPATVKAAAFKISQARNVGKTAYAQAIREVYDENISLSSVAAELEMSYYSLWAAASASAS